MSDVVIVALIGLGGTVITAAAAVITQVILNKRNREKQKAESEEERKKAAVEEALKDERLEQRLKNIEEKLDTHNGYSKKLEDVNESLNVMQTDIAVIKNDIQNFHHKGE